MSGKSNKRIVRAVKKKSDKIKVQGLQEFLDFSNAQPLRKRLIFALRVVFKRMKV